MVQPRSLKYRTWVMLKESKLPAKEVAAAIGTTPVWVRMFLADEIRDPSVNTIQRLYEFLSGQPLFRD